MDKETLKPLNFSNIQFTGGSQLYDNLPKNNILPEVAIWGRSNAGKSSLLASITTHKNMFRISKTPGCTRQINIFTIPNHLILADMPGYGYASVSKKETAEWQKLILHYLYNRKKLIEILLLIDARRGILELDEQVMLRLSYATKPFTVIITKTDKVTETELEQIIAQAASYVQKYTYTKYNNIEYRKQMVLTISNKSKKGLDKIIEKLITITKQNS